MDSKRILSRLATVILIGVAFVLGAYFAPEHDATAQDFPGWAALNELERSFAILYEQASPSVVSIHVHQLSMGEYFPWSSGSGFVYDRAGHIVTNYHVVEGGDRISINFFDGTIVRAEIIGSDPDADLAVLRVDLEEDRLFPAQLGDSDDLVIGQMALAIGSPFGQRWTLTSGIVSALDRTIQGLTRFSVGSVIQTDTPINPGSSGGPLFNLRGEIIGVNTQILSEVRANAGVGFAIPSNLVQRVATDLIDTGAIEYSYLGINGTDMNLDVMERYNLPNNMRGVIITNVLGGGPAARGGLRDLDVVIAVDDRPVIGFSSLVSYLASNTHPGQTITLTVVRNGEELDLAVNLGVRPQH